MQYDLLVQALQSDLLANILEYAVDIEKCSENITVQVREIIGARVVALLAADPNGGYRLLAACPQRKGGNIQPERDRPVAGKHRWPSDGDID